MTPQGERIADAARGLLLGNRGVLVDAHGKFTRRKWSTWAWIACVLAWKGRRRPLMQPGTWTELFFLDEATGFAAGHRPCGECRRADYQRFKQAWLVANAAQLPDGALTIQAIDRILHAERKRRWDGEAWPRVRTAALPNGAMVELEGDADAWLVWGANLLRWTPAGYTDRRSRRDHRMAGLITPPTVVEALRVGYLPLVHPSAGPVEDAGPA